MGKATILGISVASLSLALLAACGKDEAKVVVTKPITPPAAATPAPQGAAAPAPAAAAPAAQTPVAAAPASAAPAPAAPTSAPATPPPAAPVPAPAPVLASAEYNNDSQLRADLLEVKRASGGSLTVRWRLVYTAGQSTGMVAAEPKSITYDYSYPQLYYTDPAENKKYGFLTDSQQNRLMQVYYGRIEPGQQKGNWAKFPAPPATSKKITIHIPHFPPFEDVPVAD